MGFMEKMIKNWLCFLWLRLVDGGVLHFKWMGFYGKNDFELTQVPVTVHGEGVLNFKWMGFLGKCFSMHNGFMMSKIIDCFNL